ncbi:MAG: histidine kinase, partial [Acidobacteriota bacterium]|nr:histidine kinase [Acidobacteriota bacterium]
VALSSVIGVVFSLSFYLFCGPGNSLLRFWLEDFSAPVRTLVFVAYNALACPLAFASAAMIVTRIPNSLVHIAIPHFWQILVVEGALGAVMAIIIGAFLKLKLQVQRTQTETARAQALALQSQINPHFFFNTLNSISALIDDDPAASKRMIGRLADMFRYTLGCTHTESVTLEQELQFVRDYLDIEQARFPTRLRVELPRGPLPAVQVPGLVLQPLVENAVKHGIARLIDGGVVAIRVTMRVTTSGSTARISVSNTADEHGSFETVSLYRPGHALENVRARLRLFTGQSDPLQISNQGGWTEFSFESAVTVR